MPSYEYTCQNCHANIELVQSVEKNQAPVECPFCCMKHTMIRVFHQAEEKTDSKKMRREVNGGNQEKNTDR